MLNKFEQINENKEIIIDDKINENPNNNTIDNSNTNDFYNTIFGPNYAVKEIDYLEYWNSFIKLSTWMVKKKWNINAKVVKIFY